MLSSNTPAAVRILRISAALALFLAASATSVFAIDIDRNGNAHVTLQDMQDASDSQSRANASSWQQRINDNNAFQAQMAESMDKWQREVAEREAYNSPAAREARYRAYLEACQREEFARAAREAAAVERQKFLREIAEVNARSDARFARVNGYIENLKTRVSAGDVIAARRLMLDIPTYDGWNEAYKDEFGAWVNRRLSLLDLPEKILTMLAKTNPQAEIWRLSWMNLHSADLLPDNLRLAATPGDRCNDANLLLLAHELDRHEMLLEPGSGVWVGRRCTLPDARRQLLMEVLTFEIHRSYNLCNFIFDQGQSTLLSEKVESELNEKRVVQYYERLSMRAPGVIEGSADWAKIYAAGLQAGWQEFRERAGIPKDDEPDQPIVRRALDGPLDDDFYLIDPTVASVLLDRMRSSNNLGLPERTAGYTSLLAVGHSNENPARTFSGLARLMDFPDQKFRKQYGDRALLSSHYYGNTQPGGKDGLHRILPGLIPLFTKLFTTPPTELETWLRGTANLPRLRAGDAAELTTFRDLALAIAGEATKPAERERLARLVRDTFNPIEAWHAHILREKNREAGNLLLFELAAAGNHRTDTFVLAAIDDLAAELSVALEVLDEAGRQRLAARLKWVKAQLANPGMRPLLAPALLSAAVRIHEAVAEHINAMGTVREYAICSKPFPPTDRAGLLSEMILSECPDVDPKLRVGAAAIAIDSVIDYSKKLPQFLHLDGFVLNEKDPLVDPVAHRAAHASIEEATDEEVAQIRRAVLRAAKFSRDSLRYAAPWEDIPALAAGHGTPPSPKTLETIADFEKSPVGTRQRAKLAQALVAAQLKADISDPFERSSEKALFTATSAPADDGVAAFAYATLRRRQASEIPWAYPPPASRDADTKGLFSMHEQESFYGTRTREANGFAALVVAFRKNIPDAKTRLLELYDPALGADTRFALGYETRPALDGQIDVFSLLGTRARLAAVGTTNAADWLQRIAALPKDVDDAGLAAAYVTAVRTHPVPEKITGAMLRMVRDRSAGMEVFRALRTLVADPAAQRFFGPAWRDDCPSPFKTEWILEILDQKIAQEIPVPEDDFSRPLEEECKKLYDSVPAGTDVPEDVMARVNAITDELGNHRGAYREKAIRERMRGLSPKTVLLLAFASTNTTSELARTIVHEAPSGFIEDLVKFAAEEEPTLQTLARRFNSGTAGRKPISTEHWALLAEGRLWPLPYGIGEQE